jgi:hypothetical protein
MSNLHYRPLPIELEDITRDWLQAALRSYAPDVEVRSYEFVDFMRTTCTKIRIKLDLVNNRTDAPIPDSVILKGGFEPHSRILKTMHENEVHGYADILPELKLRAPKSYFADYDPDREQGIVIMEDLVQRGVDFCSALKPQGFDAIALRLEELARFHAQSWASPDFAPGRRWDWVEDMPLTQRNYFDRYLTPEVWAKYTRMPRGAAVSVRFHDREWMRDALNRMAALSAQLPHCIIHCDTHLGNLYVDVDGTPGFYDMLVSRAPSMLEIAYHLGCGLDTSDRRRLEGPLIEHYLGALRGCGVSPPTFEDAFRYYKMFLAFGYCIFIINEDIFQPEEVNTAYTARFSAAMLDHDTAGLLKQVGIPSPLGG